MIHPEPTHAETALRHDPLGVHEYHHHVRERIEAGEPGLAQGFVNELMVSYETASYAGPVLTVYSAGTVSALRATGILEELILDVARGEAFASHLTFRRARIELMIEDRLGYPPSFPKMHTQACMLRSFYVDMSGAGRILTF